MNKLTEMDTTKPLKTLSPYKNNVVASRGKALLNNLAEAALIFIFSFFFFVALAYPIINNIPAVKEATTSYVQDKEHLNNLVMDLRLREKEGDGYLSGETMANHYLNTLAKTSFYLNGETYPALHNPKEVEENETFLNKGDAENPYPLDNISYYFFVGKSKDASISSYVYNGIDCSENKEKCLYLNFFEYKDESIFEEKNNDLPLYQQLSFDNASLLADYLLYGGSSNSKSGQLYSSLQKSYLNALSKCINEVETKYQPYIDGLALLDKHYSTSVVANLIGFTGAFLLGWALNEFILPIFFKNHRTLAMKMMRVGYSCTDETEVRWWHSLFKSLVRIPLYFCTIFLMMTFLGVSSITIYSFGGFTYIIPLLISLLLLIVSAIFILILPTRQGLGELAGTLLIKDLDAYEGGEASENVVEENEHERR